MKTADGFEQACNAQAVVDNGSLVAAHVSDAANDKQQISPALEQLATAANAVGKPEALLADSGYYSANNLTLCENQNLVPYIAEGRESHNQPLEERLAEPPAPPAVRWREHGTAWGRGKARVSMPGASRRWKRSSGWSRR